MFQKKCYFVDNYLIGVCLEIIFFEDLFKKESFNIVSRGDSGFNVYFWIKKNTFGIKPRLPPGVSQIFSFMGAKSKSS